MYDIRPLSGGMPGHYVRGASGQFSDVLCAHRDDRCHRWMEHARRPRGNGAIRRVVAGESWIAGDFIAEIFFAPTNPERKEDRLDREDAAKSICRACSVRKALSRLRQQWIFVFPTESGAERTRLERKQPIG